MESNLSFHVPFKIYALHNFVFSKASIYFAMSSSVQAVIFKKLNFRI